MTESKENLSVLLETIAKELGYNGRIQIEAVSSEGANFSSTLYLATISETKKEDLKLFAKVAIRPREQQSDDDMFALGFKTECIFYTELAKAFEELYNRNSVEETDRLYMPKYYGSVLSKEENILVLENLAVKGFGSWNRMKPYDLDYATKAIEELAKFHALGLAFREENLDKLKEIGEMVTIEKGTLDNIKGIIYEQAIKTGTEVIKEEYRGRLKKFFAENDILGAVTKCWYSPSATYLIHGDYRPSNLMRRTQDGHTKVVPQDYQTIRLCTLAADVVYFLWLGSDSRFRKLHYDQMLQHYYKELTVALQNLRLDIKNVYPRETFERELEETKLLGLFLGLSMMNVLLVAPENAPTIDNLENIAVNANELALQRMNEIVEDYIRLGIV